MTRPTKLRKGRNVPLYLEADEYKQFEEIMKGLNLTPSESVRQHIHSVVEEHKKNQEGTQDLSAIRFVRPTSVTYKRPGLNESLDNWIVYSQTCGNKQELLEVIPKSKRLWQIQSARLQTICADERYLKKFDQTT